MNSATARAAAQIPRESLRVQVNPTAYFQDVFCGTAEDLLRAGVVELRHLPVLGNQRRQCASFKAGELLLGGQTDPDMRVTLKVDKKRYQVEIRRPKQQYTAVRDGDRTLLIAGSGTACAMPSGPVPFKQLEAPGEGDSDGRAKFAEHAFASVRSLVDHSLTSLY